MSARPDVVTTDLAPTPAGPYAQGRIHDGTIYVSGQGPRNVRGELPSDRFQDQAAAAFENLRAILQAAGASLGDVVKVNVYLSDIGHGSELNEVYRRYFREPYPARTTVAAGLPGILIEIDAIARLP